MESRLGVRLVERTARRLRLTEEGGVLLERAQQIAPLLARFAQQHAQLQVEPVLSDDAMDLVDDDLDLLQQIDVPASPNTVARKLLQSWRVFCAAPAYLDTRGRPQQPEYRPAHDCLCVLHGRRVLRR